VLKLVEYKFTLRIGCVNRIEQQNKCLGILIPDENLVFVHCFIESSLILDHGTFI